MNPIDMLRRSHPAFKGVTKENVSQYCTLFFPHLLIRVAKETGTFQINPVTTQLAGELGTLVLEHLVCTREDSNKYNLICHYLMDQAIITRHPAIHQVVILDLVMDSCAFRIPELADCNVFELCNNAVVMNEKERLLRQSGAKLLAKQRHVLLTDSNYDGWHRLLLAKGFQPDAPTLWILGSQLSYMSLTEGAQLIAGIELLSAPNSQIYADMFSGHKNELTYDGKSFVTVQSPECFELQGDNGRVFQKLKTWVVELLARRDDEFNYYGTMWDPKKLDPLRVLDRGAAYLGPWFVARFSRPSDTNRA